MAVGTGREVAIDFHEVLDALEKIKDARTALNRMDKHAGTPGYAPKGTQLMRTLRAESRKMAATVVVPAVKSAGHATGSPFDAAVADTARAVNDRIPVVKVGKVQPKISGFKRTSQAKRARAKGQLAYGSEYGPKGGGEHERKGQRGGARPGVNYYGHPRSLQGRWLYYAVNSGAVTRGVIAGYAHIVNTLFDLYEVDKFTTGRAA